MLFLSVQVTRLIVLVFGSGTRTDDPQNVGIVTLSGAFVIH